MMPDINHILGQVKELNFFSFIEDKEIRNILDIFLSYVLYNYTIINKSSNNEILVELKTHTILIYIGAIVEAIVYYFAKEKLSNKEKYRRKYLELEEFRKYQDIKNTNLVICEKIKKEFSLNDSINFKALIDGLKDKKIVPEKIIKKIDNFRKARNSVHINVYKSGEEIFENLEKLFNDFKDILVFIKKNL